MKCRFIVLVCLLTLFFAGADALAFLDPFAPVWDFDQPRILGHPKKIEIVTPSYIRKESYNEKGQRLDVTILTPQGEVGIRYLFVYDTDGNLVGVDIFQGLNTNPARERAQYSTKGKIHAIEGFYEPKRALCFYNDKGRLDQIVGVDANGQRSLVWKYNWTDSGNLAELDLAGASAELLAKRVYAYNDNNFPKTIENFDAKGELVSRISVEYKYDKQGNWVEKKAQREVFSGKTAKAEKSEVKRRIEYY